MWNSRRSVCVRAGMDNYAGGMDNYGPMYEQVRAFACVRARVRARMCVCVCTRAHVGGWVGARACARVCVYISRPGRPS